MITHAAASDGAGACACLAERGFAPAQVDRQNLERVATVGAATTPDLSVAEASTAITTALEDIKLPAGYSVKLGGETEQLAETFGYVVEAILLDKRKIMPCSVYLQGEYGVRDVFVGVPVKLGARGVEKIIEITLTPAEDAAFKKSAAAVKELVDVIKV